MTFTITTVSRPRTVTFGDDTAASTAVTLATAGDYVLRLTANNGELTTADDVAIAVLPDIDAPVVSVGADQSVTLPRQMF